MNFDYVSKWSQCSRWEGSGQRRETERGGEILMSSQMMHETLVCNFPSLALSAARLLALHHQRGELFASRFIFLSLINADLDSLVYHHCGFKGSLHIHHGAAEGTCGERKRRNTGLPTAAKRISMGGGGSVEFLITQRVSKSAPPSSMRRDCLLSSVYTHLLKCHHFHL